MSRIFFTGRAAASARITRVVSTLLVILGSIAVGPIGPSGQTAWACSTAGQNSSGYSYSSQLSASAITICNQTGSITNTPASSTTSIVQTPSKPVVICTTKRQTIFSGPPAFTTRQANVTVCGTSISVKNVVPPPPPRTATTTVQATQISNSAAANASFSPDPIQVQADQLVVQPNLPVGFNAIASVHYRTGALLGQGVTVRFTPSLISWDFGAGLSAPKPFSANSQIPHSFEITGSQSVLAVVRFEAAYRFAGQSNWTTESGYLAKDASVTIVVQRASPPIAAQVTPPPKTPRVRLVASTCLEKPMAKGCP